MVKAMYPGTFNPLHEGHMDVIKKVLPIVDKLYIVTCFNPDKDNKFDLSLLNKYKETHPYYGTFINKYAHKIEVHGWKGLLADYVKSQKPDVLIRGLRNGQDFEYEKTQQYWNEDLGLTIPTMYIISDRKLVHISSSAIRQVEKFK